MDTLLLTLLSAAVLWAFLGVKVARKLFRLRIQPFPWAGRFLESRWREWAWSSRRVAERSFDPSARVLLDIGCGRGAPLVEFVRRLKPGATIIAVDADPAAIERSRARLLPGVIVVRADAQELPLRDASVDAVTMLSSLFEMKDPERAIRECARVLRPGGTLAVTEMLIDPDFPLPATVHRVVRPAGLVFIEQRGNLWHYTLLYGKVEPRRPCTPA